MAASGNAVDVRSVTKRFAGTAALDSVDLFVDAGAIHGLLGPNGAGKTTLLSILFGLERPDAGAVRLFGRTPSEAGRGWLDGVAGFVETPRFYPYLSGRRNLQVLAGLDDGESPLLVDEMLELVGLESAATRRVRGYSLGMRQRLGVAAALMRRPRLLILDEPTNGMDPAAARDLRDALRRLAYQGLAVLLSSHNMAEVNEACDSVTILDKGRVAAAGPLDGLRASAPDPAWRLETNDDVAALRMAEGSQGVKATAADARGLHVVAGQACLDDFVVELGCAGIAVRALTSEVTSLESLFFHLTESEAT